MTTWLVTRHPGAIEWIRNQQISIDKQVDHLDIKSISAGDTVIGILPVNLAAEVCLRGGTYINLSTNLPMNTRGREMTSNELDQYEAKLECYAISRIPNPLDRKE